MDMKTRVERVAYWLAKTEKVLTQKQEEYAANSDALHNFKRGSAMTGGKKSPEEILRGFLLKHWISINDIIDAADEGKDLPPRHVIEEKIGDVINYMILLDCLLYDREELYKPLDLFGEVSRQMAENVDRHMVSYAPNQPDDQFVGFPASDPFGGVVL